MKERRKYTTGFFEEWARTGQYSSAFWRFAHDLSERVADAGHYKIKPLQNLVWTNICKIGVVRGNPAGELVRVQSALAILTLRTEIEMYRPKLIVFVTGDYATEVVNRVVGGSEKKWDREGGREGFWCREAIGKTPATLWTYHPERKSRGLLRAWLREALRLAT